MKDYPPFKVAIPARYASTRLPGKPLRIIAGKPMIEHVFNRAVESGAEEVVIATDDHRIRSAALGFGAKVCMTSAGHPSGTDRIAEVSRTLGWNSGDIVVNLQGDEPLMEPFLMRQVAVDLAEHGDAAIATLATPIHTTAQLFDPHVVKVVMDVAGYALYFSRAAIPWDRDAFTVTSEVLPEDSEHYRHVGLYAYRADFLDRYTRLPPCYPERTESLEQLRALWNGIRIHVSITAAPPGHGVDTDDDLKQVEALLATRSTE
jgi:3-deoxy-manno-octulosonate cytidylyltransferase (CMP-KDO synthetase)